VTFTVATGFEETAGGELGPGILQPASAAETICAVVATELGQLDGGGVTLATGFGDGAGFDVLLTEVLIDVAALDDFCSVAVAHTKT
jgi:hypothetical protein